MARIEEEVGGYEIYIYKKNRKIGYLISTCPVKSIVKEELYAKGSRKNGAGIQIESEAIERRVLHLPKPKLSELSSGVFKPCT